MWTRLILVAAIVSLAALPAGAATTAYHPQNNHHCLRIPTEAQAWNSGYLLPKQGFAMTLTTEGYMTIFASA